MNQLANAYTINNEFSKAEELLLDVQSKSKDKNSQVYNVSLMYRTENYIKWAKDLISRKKLSNGITYLEKAKDLIIKLNHFDPNNVFNFYYCRELLFTYGLLHECKKEYNIAGNYYRDAVGKIFGKKSEGKFKKVVARSYYHLALVNEKLGDNKENILDIIIRGKKECKKGMEIFDDLSDLESRIKKYNKKL